MSLLKKYTPANPQSSSASQNMGTMLQTCGETLNFVLRTLIRSLPYKNRSVQTVASVPRLEKRSLTRREKSDSVLLEWPQSPLVVGLKARAL